MANRRYCRDQSVEIEEPESKRSISEPLSAAAPASLGFPCAALGKPSPIRALSHRAAWVLDTA